MATGFGSSKPRYGPKEIAPTHKFTPQTAAAAAIPQTAHDYDTIMGGYKKLHDEAGVVPKTPGRNMLESAYGGMATGGAGAAGVAGIKGAYKPMAYSPIAAEATKYTPSADVTNSVGNLRNLSVDGGYSGQNLADMRARGIAPIRAVYANAGQNMQRQKAISGGYAPGMAAATSRMARESSELIAGQSQNIEADIAEKQAAGRRTMGTAYDTSAGRESGRTFDADSTSVEARNRVAEVNAGNLKDYDLTNASNQKDYDLDETNRGAIDQQAKLAGLGGLSDLNEQDMNFDNGAATKLKALSGMNSLYGTTPALANLFGSQAMALDDRTAQTELQKATAANELAAQKWGVSNQIAPPISRPTSPIRRAYGAA